MSIGMSEILTIITMLGAVGGFIVKLLYREKERVYLLQARQFNTITGNLKDTIGDLRKTIDSLAFNMNKHGDQMLSLIQQMGKLENRVVSLEGHMDRSSLAISSLRESLNNASKLEEKPIGEGMYRVTAKK